MLSAGCSRPPWAEPCTTAILVISFIEILFFFSGFQSTYLYGKSDDNINAASDQVSPSFRTKFRQRSKTVSSSYTKQLILLISYLGMYIQVESKFWALKISLQSPRDLGVARKFATNYCHVLGQVCLSLSPE